MGDDYRKHQAMVLFAYVLVGGNAVNSQNTELRTQHGRGVSDARLAQPLLSEALPKAFAYLPEIFDFWSYPFRAFLPEGLGERVPRSLGTPILGVRRYAEIPDFFGMRI